MKPAGFVLLIVTAIVSLGQASAQDAPLPANQQQPQSLDNAQLDQLVAPSRPDFDATTRRGELDRVAEQIRQDLSDSTRIGIHP